MEEELTIKNKETQPIADTYDLLALASNVETPSNIINRDFTLSWTTPQLERWANKQIIIAKLFYDTLKNVDETEADNAKDLLIHEVILMLGFTKSREGRVLRAVLETGKGIVSDEDERDTKKMGMFAKMLVSATGKRVPEEEV